jgi:hypothetical protein
VKTLKAYWYRNENNFGDILTPWLIRHIAGAEAEFSERDSDDQKYVTAGSILDNDIKNSIVWGTGIARATDTVSLCHQDIRAVRGPISAKMVFEATGKTITVLGDPGIVISRFYTPKPLSMRTETIGIIPHYVDYQKCKELQLEKHGFKVIDITKGVDALLNEASTCSKIFSSSLHGIIASHALRVPAAWIKLSNDVLGDDTKFYDYYESLGVSRASVDLLDMRNLDGKGKIMAMRSHHPLVSAVPDKLVDKLVEACPFKI